MTDRRSDPPTLASRLALLSSLGLLCGVSHPLFERMAAAASAALRGARVRIGVLEGDAELVLARCGSGSDEAATSAFSRRVVEAGAPLTSDGAAPGELAQSRAGVPLIGGNGEPVGFLCAAADGGREWRSTEMETLREIAAAAVGALELCLDKVLLEGMKESSEDGVLVVTLDRRVVAHNRRFAEIWRVPEEVLTTGSDDALLDSVLARVAQPEVFRGRVEEVYARVEDEVRDEIVLSDGRVLSRHGTPWRGADGAPRGRIWQFRDITEPHRAKAALEESEERLRAFVETAPDATFTVDEHGIITYTNPAVERIFGYTPAELIGRPLAAVIPDRPHGGGPTGVRRIAWGAMELTGLHRDGREIPIEISFGRFTTGGRTLYTGIARDITERKQVERVMHDAALSYRSLFDSLQDLVCIIDVDGNLLSVNAAVLERHGFALEEILGGSPERLSAPGWTEPTALLQRAREAPAAEPVRFEWWGGTKDGEIFPMEVVLTRGQYFGAPVVIAVGRDITERMDVELALRDSEERFRQIAENIREDFWIYDAAFERTIYVSPAHEEVWGFPVERAYREPRSFLASVLPEDVPRLVAGMEQVGGGGGAVRVEYRIRRPDGSVRWAWSRVFPVLDERGEVYRVVGTTEDVTERKEAEQALRRLGTIVESSADGIVSLSPDGVVTSWNPAAERIFGYRAEEIVGRNWAVVVPPEARDSYEEARRMLVDGAPATYEAVRIRADGERINVAVTAFPIHDEDGRVTGTAAIVRDVTETNAREEQRRLLAAALERLEEGVSLETLSGEIVYANQNHGRILGYDAAARPLPSLREFAVSDETAVEQEEIVRRVVEEGGWVGRVRRRRADDGRVIPLELIMGRIDREGEGPTLLFGIVRDITEQLDRERFLRRAERLASLGTLVGGAAHELNNPLHAVRSFAELMLLEPRSAEDAEALEIIKREADRAAKIVSDLRLFARQTQDETSERTAVDLNDVVRHVAKVRRYSLAARNITIIEELSSELPPVRANLGEVEQVVLNLWVNAEQALANEPGERRLLVRTVADGAVVTLLVSDSGPGIAPEHRDRIFDPFFTTKPPGEGTGLGLSIVHSIVTDHGGEIQVESAPGRGTTFSVSLPRAAPALTPPGGQRGVGIRPEAGPRVLVVEGVDTSRRATARYLARVGYRVDAAADAAEALRLLEAGEYDAILCEVGMPGLSAESLLRLVNDRGGGVERRLVFIARDEDGPSSEVDQLTARGVPVLMEPLRLELIAREIDRVTGGAASRSTTAGS